jgi:hypothetical protein
MNNAVLQSNLLFPFPMPASIDPPPAEDEFECANCGAYFHYELTRCPNCGIDLYGAGGPAEGPDQRDGLLRRMKDSFHRMFNKPYSADEVFGDALDASILFNDLLAKVGGDRSTTERLIRFEQELAPAASRRQWIRSAIQRWEQDNRAGPAGY